MDNLFNLSAAARLQLGFMQGVLLPLWEPLALCFSALAPCMQNLRNNRNKWQIIVDGNIPDGEDSIHMYLPYKPSSEDSAVDAGQYHKLSSNYDDSEAESFSSDGSYLSEE
jgi:hypothetical protein